MTTLPPWQLKHAAGFSPANGTRYIENKSANQRVIEELLSHSTTANNWTNFGRVSQLLEERLTELLGLSDNLRVIAFSNAKVALHTLVAMLNYPHSKALRWVTPVFEFYSSCDGILHSAEIADCNQHGMLDLNSRDPSKFDGMFVTNIFDQHRELSEYQTQADKHKKILLIDSAMGFHSDNHIANECISLHHTKPWGFGEGGCAIVEQQHADLFRDMLAFRHHSLNTPINRLASNGKISDIVSAYLMMQLQEIDLIRDSYQEQFLQIKTIGAKLGLNVLGGNASHPGIPAHAPFLPPRTTHLASDPLVPAHKYYSPLAATPTASDIFSRIENFARHSEMMALSDRLIESLLENQMLAHP